MLRSILKTNSSQVYRVNSTPIRNLNSRCQLQSKTQSTRTTTTKTTKTRRNDSNSPRNCSSNGKGITNSIESKRKFHTTSSINQTQRDSSTGGIPNDGSHPTVYDDFFNLLEGGAPQAVEVKSMSPTSFTLTDGLVISQPCIFLNGSVFLWDPPHLDRMKATPGGAGWEDWNDHVWTLFQISSPKPEILIFGTGKTVLPPPAKVKNHLNSLGIQIDVQDSRNACSTFNLLSEEGRRVAIALLPSERSPTKKIQSSSS